MTITCVTNEYGYTILVTQVQVASSEVAPFAISALVDTGASVSMISKKLIKKIKASPTDIELVVHGVDGETAKRLYHFDLIIGDFFQINCEGMELDEGILGYDLVLGLDIILKTGLTIDPDGQHRLAA